MAGENDKFEVYQDKRGEYRWRRIASNGRIVGASSEGYNKKVDSEANMKRGPNPKDKWEFWRRRAVNGNIIGASSEGYTKKADAEANASRQGYQG